MLFPDNFLSFNRVSIVGAILAPFVFGELGLGDAEGLGQFNLTQFEAAYLPDSLADSSKVWMIGAGRIFLAYSQNGYIIVPREIFPSFCQTSYTAFGGSRGIRILDPVGPMCEVTPAMLKDASSSTV